MYRLIILLSIALTAAGDGVDMGKCIDALKSPKKCCKVPALKKNSFMYEDIKECQLMPEIANSCEKAICIGTKLGIATEDGTVKMDLLKKRLDEKLSDHKDVMDAIYSKCFDDKYKLYGESDECDLSKMGNCIRFQYVFRCQDISTDEDCKDFKDLAAQCLKLDVN